MTSEPEATAQMASEDRSEGAQNANRLTMVFWLYTGTSRYAEIFQRTYFQ